MTLRETAINAMTELGFTQAKIASILTFMDTAEPHCIERVQEEVPAGKEQEYLEVAKKFFAGNHNNPMNN